MSAAFSRIDTVAESVLIETSKILMLQTYRSGDVKSSLLELTKQEYDKLVQAKPSSFPRCRNGGNKQDSKAKQMMVVRWH